MMEEVVAAHVLDVREGPKVVKVAHLHVVTKRWKFQIIKFIFERTHLQYFHFQNEMEIT